MARDPGLEDLLRDTLGDLPGLSETTMFGGRAFMIDSHLLCAARHDGLLVRLGKGGDGWALDVAGIAPMQMGERRMQGWVRAAAEVCGDDALRRRLVDAALAFVRTLPAKS